MNAIIVPLDKEILVERDAAVRTGIKFHHPTADAIRIKLLVPGRVKRVGRIASFAVAAHFHHLRTTGERLIGLLRMRRAIHNSTDANRAGLLWIEWIRDVVLQKLARSPTRNIKKFVVEGQINVR